MRDASVSLFVRVECPYKRIYQKDSQESFCKAKREGIVENLKRHIDYKIKNNR